MGNYIKILTRIKITLLKLEIQTFRRLLYNLHLLSPPFQVHVAFNTGSHVVIPMGSVSLAVHELFSLEKHFCILIYLQFWEFL